MKSYSERNRNDLFVVDVLKGKRNGFFVEAGALDGVQVSNTLLLEEDFGWTGLCVEPDPELFDELCQNRECVCEKACLYDGHTEVVFMGGVRGWGGVLEHLYESTSANWGRGQPITMPTVTLDSLLDKHQAPQVIDYLSLDTEGSEFVILKDFPFDRFHFRVISIEGQSCNDLLTSKGYQLVTNPFNTEALWEQYFLGDVT